jgi:hypothetical protein
MDSNQPVTAHRNRFGPAYQFVPHINQTWPSFSLPWSVLKVTYQFSSPRGAGQPNPTAHHNRHDPANQPWLILHVTTQPTKPRGTSYQSRPSLPNHSPSDQSRPSQPNCEAYLTYHYPAYQTAAHLTSHHPAFPSYQTRPGLLKKSLRSILPDTTRPTQTRAYLCRHDPTYSPPPPRGPSTSMTQPTKPCGSSFL